MPDQHTPRSQRLEVLHLKQAAGSQRRSRGAGAAARPKGERQGRGRAAHTAEGDVECENDSQVLARHFTDSGQRIDDHHRIIRETARQTRDRGFEVPLVTRQINESDERARRTHHRLPALSLLRRRRRRRLVLVHGIVLRVEAHNVLTDTGRAAVRLLVLVHENLYNTRHAPRAARARLSPGPAPAPVRSAPALPCPALPPTCAVCLLAIAQSRGRCPALHRSALRRALICPNRRYPPLPRARQKTSCPSTQERP
jgi:hypothetical protein